MIELLALRQQTSVDELVATVPRPASGIPMNALPGWENVPLCHKLPMLKWPNNKIVFSRNKIGKKLWKTTEFILYDPNGYTVRIDYNSLHDPHLKKFYSKEANRILLRKIGKLTTDNNVICTLKDFNSYRRYLRRLHIDLVNKEIKRREIDHRDKIMYSTVQNLGKKEKQKFENMLNSRRNRNLICATRERCENERKQKFIENLNNIKRKIEQFERAKATFQEVLQEQKRIHNIAILQRLKYADDIERQRIIALKKRFKIRDIRMLKHKYYYLEVKRTNAQEAAQISWNKRLESSPKRHERNMNLRTKAEEERTTNVLKRKETVRAQWEKIQKGILQRTIARHKRKTKILNSQQLIQVLQRKLNMALNSPKKSIVSNARAVSGDLVISQNLSIQDIEDAVDTAKLISPKPSVEQDHSLKIVESAKYILEEVVRKVNRDLSTDEKAVEYLSTRIRELLSQIKDHIVQKATILLTKGEHIREQLLQKNKNLPNILKNSFFKKRTLSCLSKSVSFGGFNSIGQSAQKIDSKIALKSVQTRTPTPTGSLTSLMAILCEQCVSEDDFLPLSRTNVILSHWTKEERIFIEHYYIKLKKSLIVGVEQRVFTAIELHKQQLITDTRQEVLDLDRDYLVKVIVDSILSYHMNSYNFHGNLRLCTSFLANNIIYELQKGILKSENDPRYLVPPRCRNKLNFIK